MCLAPSQARFVGHQALTRLLVCSPTYVIFMHLTSGRGMESVQLPDIRVPPLLFSYDVVHEASTDCHRWCALERLVADCGAVGMRCCTLKFWATVLQSTWAAFQWCHVWDHHNVYIWRWMCWCYTVVEWVDEFSSVDLFILYENVAKHKSDRRFVVGECTYWF